MGGSQYACVDLKSYYASVECLDRGLDPLKTNLVVADESRSDKTICLAVSPSLKALGIPGRPRLFEVKQKLAEIRARTGREVPYLIAVPRMARYLELSAEIYGRYLQYLSPQDIHVYSIDEAFFDLTPYQKLYRTTARELVAAIIRDVLYTVGITAAGGVGTNLYLAKIAMDIVAKHIPADRDGVRVAELNELSFREKLWEHRPLTDFWQIGPGIERRLQRLGVSCMGDLALLSLQNEELLFREFGVDAEILIDHAWGQEPCGMKQIKAYAPAAKSIASGQVLKRPYSWAEGRVVVREMADQVTLELAAKGCAAGGVTLYVGYEAFGREGSFSYEGPVKERFGKPRPASAHGTEALPEPTVSPAQLEAAVLRLYDRLTDRRLQVRRMSVAAIRLCRQEETAPQLSLFREEQEALREQDLLRAVLRLHGRFGKNAVLKGHDLFDEATTVERNGQIGGHRK